MARAPRLIYQAWRQRRLYPGEPVDLELPDEIEALVALKAEIGAIAAACREVSSQLTERMILTLGDQGIARFGPTFYRVRNPSTWRIKESARQRFWQWVKAHDLAPQLFNVNQARIGPLRSMHELPDPETGELLSKTEWMDEFVDQLTLDRLELEELPESRMANWQAKLPDGFIRKGGPIPDKQGETHDGDTRHETV